MTESGSKLLATNAIYRPKIIEGGYRRNKNEDVLRAGWPWVSNRWRIWEVTDGILTWQHGNEQWRCTPGMWVIHQADRVASHMECGVGSRWAQLRFSLCPSDPEGDPLDQQTWGVSLPQVLTPDQARVFQPMLRDILAWWWRDDWHLVQAESRLLSMLTELAAHYHGFGGSHPIKRNDRFTAAERIWHSRPLASLPEVAAACGVSYRTFTRRFQEERGCTPNAYARTIMVTLACDLLRDHKHWSVERIARHLGYSHASSFIRAFQSELSVTPQRWRLQRVSR